MTVEKFQELYVISQMETDEVSKSMLLAQSFTGLDEETINKMSPKRFNRLCSNILKDFDVLKTDWDNTNPKAIIYANGRYYQMNYDISKKPNNAGKYVELATFSEDMINNLHKILATMATPLKVTWKGLKPTERDHPDIADDMLKAEFKVAYQAAVFFYIVFKESMKSLSTYLIEELPMEKRAEFLKAMELLTSISDGFTLPKWYLNWKASHLKQYGVYLPDNF
jgi:hypothetical protein